jgi:hypothetical protein
MGIISDANTSKDGANTSNRDADASNEDASTSSTLRIGMNPGAGSTSSDITTWSKYINELHATAVRLFFPVYTWAPSGDDSPYYWGDNVTILRNGIEGYASQGFRVTITIAAGPCSSSHACPGLPKATGAMRSDNSPANEFDAFLSTFVLAIGTSTFQKVSSVEVWNEWDNAGNGSPYGYSTGNGFALYTASQVTDDLLHAAYVTLKGFNPNVEIVAGSVITSRESDIAALVTAGATPWVDAFSYHPYYSSLSGLMSGLATAKKGVPAGKKLTLTEWGCNSGSFDAPATSGSAENLTASFAVLRAAGLEEADYYVMNSDQFSHPDQLAYGLVSATYSGGGATTAVTTSAPQSPLFDAFQMGAQ